LLPAPPSGSRAVWRKSAAGFKQLVAPLKLVEALRQTDALTFGATAPESQHMSSGLDEFGYEFDTGHFRNGSMEIPGRHGVA
jgi:hypothetical protein